MRALLVTHGSLGEGLLQSARQVYDVEAPISVLSNAGRDAAQLRQCVARWLDESPGPAILLVDVGGGSCGVAARMAAQGRPEVWILGGVNLPMVLTYLTGHNQMEPRALVEKMLDRALNAVALMGDEG